MRHSLKYFIVLAGCSLLAFSCSKWEDKTGPDPGLSSHYCNIPLAINYNHGYPGIEDNSICVFPSDPFKGNYSFMDTIYRSDVDTVFGPELSLSIEASSQKSFRISGFCNNGRQLLFTADRYYHAASDTTSIGAGMQLMCRDLDTLTGAMDYRPDDSSLYLEFRVVSDTGTVTHKGRAYKK